MPDASAEDIVERLLAIEEEIYPESIDTPGDVLIENVDRAIGDYSVTENSNGNYEITHAPTGNTFVFDGDAGTIPAGVIQNDSVPALKNFQSDDVLSQYPIPASDIAGINKTYVQSSEPSSAKEGDGWLDTDTGVFRVYADLGGGLEWSTTSPIRVLQEATFTGSDVSLSHSSTATENGSVRLAGTGSTASRQQDDQSINENIDTGLIVNPNTTLGGVEPRISANESGSTRAYLRRHSDGSLIDDTDISGLSAGDKFSLYGELSAGTEYRVTTDAEGSSYTRGYLTASATFPYTSPDLDLTASVYDGSTGTDNAVSLNDVTSITRPNSGSVLIYWSKPSDLRSWDTATYRATPDGGSVTMDVLLSQAFPVDFEDNDISGWTGSVGQLSTTTTPALQGTYSGQLDSNNGTNRVTSPVAGAPGNVIKFRLQIGSDTGNDNDYIQVIFRDSADNLLTFVQFNDSTKTIEVHNQQGFIDTGVRWSVGTTHEVELQIYPNKEEFEFIFDGSSIGQFNVEDTAQWNHADVLNSTVFSSSSRTVYFDAVEPTRNVVMSDISQGFDISGVRTDRNIVLRLNLSRPNPSANTTVDYSARRFLR